MKQWIGLTSARAGLRSAGMRRSPACSFTTFGESPEADYWKPVGVHEVRDLLGHTDIATTTR